MLPLFWPSCRSCSLSATASRPGGTPDLPLSEAGAKAAGALIARLHDLAPDAVYSSPYERAQATVRPFAISAGLSVGLDDRLRERVLSDRDLEDRLDHVRRSFAEPDYRAPRRREPQSDAASRHRRLDRHCRRGPSAAGRLQPPQPGRFRTTIDGCGVRFRAMAGLADPRPVRSRTRRRSADQVRTTGRPPALLGAVTRPSPRGQPALQRHRTETSCRPHGFGQGGFWRPRKESNLRPLVLGTVAHFQWLSWQHTRGTGCFC